MENKVRVGVIGCGAIGRDHIRRLTGLVAETEVVAVADFVPEAALFLSAAKTAVTESD